MTMRITMTQTRMGESGSLLTSGSTYTVSDAFGQAMVPEYATDTDGALTYPLLTNAQILTTAPGVQSLVDADGNSLGTGTGANSCLIIGDSVAAQDTPTSSGGYLQFLSNGIFSAVNARLGGRLDLLNVLGQSGERSDQILARLSDFLASYAYGEVGYAFVHVGANDVVQYVSAPRTVAQYKETVIDICQMLFSRNIRPVLFDIPGSASLITTAAMSDMWTACNRALREIARENPQVILISYTNVMIDVTANYPSNLAARSDGSFHPNSLAAKYIADYAYAILDPIIPRLDLFDTHYHASAANTLALTANPLMQGSASATGILTGNVPTGVLVTGSGTGSGVASLVTNSNGPVGCQFAQVAYTGPASAVNGTDYVGALGTSSAVALATAGLAVGDVLQGFWEINVAGTIANFMGAEIFLNFVGASGTVTPPIGPTAAYTRAYGNKQNNSSAPLVALGTVGYGASVLATPKMPIPSGTTAIQLFCRAYPVSGSSGATFTVQFGRNLVVKVA